MVDYPPMVPELLKKLFPDLNLSIITDGPLIKLDMILQKNDFTDNITLLQLREKWDQVVKQETDRILKSSGSIPIIIDGPNVLRYKVTEKIKGKYGKLIAMGKAEILIKVVDKLKNDLKIDNITVVVSAATRHYINFPEYLINLEEQGMLMVTPAGRDDDYFAIKHAHESSGFILSNDRYEKWIELNPEFKKWISRFRISFTIHPTGTIHFDTNLKFY